MHPNTLRALRGFAGYAPPGALLSYNSRCPKLHCHLARNIKLQVTRFVARRVVRKVPPVGGRGAKNFSSQRLPGAGRAGAAGGSVSSSAATRAGGAGGACIARSGRRRKIFWGVHSPAVATVPKGCVKVMQ